MKSLSIITAGILLPLLIFAQVPQKFKYQAIARNDEGRPIVDQTISVKIGILDSPDSPVPIYEETHTSITNQFGLFMVQIGTGETSSSFDIIDWTSGEKWIEIMLDTTGGENFILMGTSQLLTVPYAMFAQNAGNGSSQWSSNGSGIHYNDGSVTIGNNVPDESAKLKIQSDNQGFLPPRLSNEQRDLINNPAIGLIIYNTTTNCINVFKPTGWFEMCGNCITPSTPNITGNTEYCENEELGIMATGAPGANYIWSGPNGFSDTTAVPSIENLSLSDNGIYIVFAQNSCGQSDNDSIEITINPLPTTSNAGIDQNNISGTQTTLEGNTPSEGTGKWSLISGTNGLIDDENNPESIFSGEEGESYILSWSISNDCGNSTDEVIINFASTAFVCGSDYTDSRDGQTYPTVLLGSQCWFAKNMNYGTQINGAVTQSNNGTVEKYCYGDNVLNCDTDGGLYMWDELMNYSTIESSQGICPEGWHIPSDYEWQLLERTIGMDSTTAALANQWRGSDEGTKLKAGGTSGFNIILAGRSTTGGNYSVQNSYEYQYTSTESGTYAWRRCLSSTASNIGRYATFPKSYGLSVRCLKND
jgi:uncharacterized protein (TIGR02145 family)